MAQKSRQMKFPLRISIPMVLNYIKMKLKEQVKAVAFIIIYLIAFKIIVLQSAPESAVQMAIGVGLVVLGLASFLEGLFLGLMPLGDRVGVQLPQKTNIWVIMIFGLLLGFGATLAEPSIATLRMAGEDVTPWATPLLYRFLEVDNNLLVWAVGGGVGLAVAAGMARFYFGMGLKPFLFILTPLLLVMSAFFAADDNLKYIINLAWDTGGVTTGPVTVPLVLAMGIGISKASGKNNSAAASGLGVVTLASLFPVLGVFIMGLYLNTTTPKPMSEIEFFSPAYRTKALETVKTEEALAALAFQRGTSAGRISYYSNQEKYHAAVLSLLDFDDKESGLLGTESLTDWLRTSANEEEKQLISQKVAESYENSAAIEQATEKYDRDYEHSKFDFKKIFKEEAYNAIFAVVPLVLLLLLVLVFLLRDKLRKADEVILGIILALVGMAILTTGIQLGLSSLGSQIGKNLPTMYKSEAQEEGRVLIKSFDKDSMISAYNSQGKLTKYFYFSDKANNLKTVPFDESKYNKETGTYEYIQQKDVLWTTKISRIFTKTKVSRLGIFLICLFAFGMGYGSTVAEPALNALGVTVEEMTVGTVKRKKVVGTVSIGVGIGLLVGVLKLIYDIPACWLLIPGYIALLVLTHFCDEEFTGLAWDSGGVTTGPITVPLVLAMGLGIGGGLNVVDGFGIVSMASLFPIITMLMFGIRIRKRQNMHLGENGEARK